MSPSPVPMPAFRHASWTGPMDSQAAASETSKPSARSRIRTSEPSDRSRETIAAPIPDAPPVTRADGGGHAGEAGMASMRRRRVDASGNKDDLADALPLLDQRMGIAGALQGERRADERLHGAGLPQGEELSSGGLDDVRSQLHQPAEIETLQHQVATDHERRVERFPPAVGETRCDDRAERVQRADRTLEDLT